jgi:D-methionine transport system substrate-binding protein
MKRSSFILALLSSALLLGTSQAQTQPLRIGASAGVHADTLAAAVQDAKKAGLDVKIIEFTDWTTPNAALAAGDLDVNYFQHQAFLDNAIKERGYKFDVAGLGVLPNIGLFSYKIKSFAELKEGAKVGVASDPVNQGRGLALLEKAGLIKLKDGVGARGTVNDIVSNPKKLRIAEVEGPQLVRAIDDLDLAQGIPAHFVSAGKPQVASSGLLYTGASDDYFAIRFVTRKDNANDPRIKTFVKVFQESRAVREQVHKLFAGDAKLYTLAWLPK